MMQLRNFLLFPALALLTTAATLSSDYTPTEDYAVKFSTSGAEGTFKDLKGNISFDMANLSASNFDVSVATSTIETGNSTKNKHAKSDSWLDADAYPRIQFKSSAFAKTQQGYEVKGQLSLHGKSKAVTIPFSFNDNVFEGDLTVSREDFEIEGPFLFGGLVGDDVEISLKIPVQLR